MHAPRAVLQAGEQRGAAKQPVVHGGAAADTPEGPAKTAVAPVDPSPAREQSARGAKVKVWSDLSLRGTLEDVVGLGAGFVRSDAQVRGLDLLQTKESTTNPLRPASVPPALPTEVAVDRDGDSLLGDRFVHELHARRCDAGGWAWGDVERQCLRRVGAFAVDMQQRERMALSREF